MAPRSARRARGGAWGAGPEPLNWSRACGEAGGERPFEVLTGSPWTAFGTPVGGSACPRLGDARQAGRRPGGGL